MAPLLRIYLIVKYTPVYATQDIPPSLTSRCNPPCNPPCYPPSHTPCYFSCYPPPDVTLPCYLHVTPMLPPRCYIHAVRSRDDITFRQDTTPADHVAIVDEVHNPGVTMRVGFVTPNNKTTGVNRGNTGNPTVH